MRSSNLDRIFVLVAFVIIYTVITKGVSLTGSVIEQQEESVARLSDFDDARYVLPVDGDFSIAVPGLRTGNMLTLVNGVDAFELVVLRVYQSLEYRDEHVSLMIGPGGKRFLLSEGEEVLVDLDNDGRSDLLVKAAVIQSGQAVLVLSSP